jgi:hypothetical protein
MGSSRKRNRQPGAKNGGQTLRRGPGEESANRGQIQDIDGGPGLDNALAGPAAQIQAGVTGGGLYARQAEIESGGRRRRLGIGGGSAATIPTNAPRGGTTPRGGVKIGGN